MPRGKGKGRGRGHVKQLADGPKEECQIPGRTKPSAIQRPGNIDNVKPGPQNKTKHEHYHAEASAFQLEVCESTTKDHFSPHCAKQVESGMLSCKYKTGDATQGSKRFAVNGIDLPSSSCEVASGTSGNDSQAGSSMHSAFFSYPVRKTGMDIVRRPNHGSQGDQIRVVANYFLLSGRGKCIYHYDVEIEDASASRKKPKIKTIKEEKKSNTPQLEIEQKRNVGKQKCRDIISKLINDKGLAKYFPFYDGQKNLYAFRPLLSGKKSEFVTLSCGTYRVTVQPANKNGAGNVIDLGLLNDICQGLQVSEIPQEAIMAFDMILRHCDAQLLEVVIGRSVFSFTEVRRDPLSSQFEIWQGSNQSLHLTERGPAVVVNTTTKAFHAGGFVIEHCCDVLGFDITTQRLGQGDILKLSKSLAGLKVEATHLPYPRRYTVITVTEEPATILKVDIGDQRMSVAQFFSKKYKKLRFPDLPCLQMKTTGKPTYTPMECCIIPPGQPKLGLLEGHLTREMISKTAKPPVERFEAIENYARAITGKSGSLVKQTGMTMAQVPLNLIARILPPPALAYKNVYSVQPDNRGVWRIDGRNFAETSAHATWVLISFIQPHICPQEMLKNLSSALVHASTSVGLCLNNPLEIQQFDQRTNTEEALKRAKDLEVDFAFVILSRNDRYHSYEELKFVADIKIGLVTQCMDGVVVPKCCDGRQGSGQILNNILSKLNIKLGGINHKFSQQPSVSMRHTIVMGADAAHSPRGSKCPSIAAVVGNVDDIPFQYAVDCRVQMNPDQSKLSQEIILDMKKMTKHILSKYREMNRDAPEKIIFFRDGVSEGQFEIVLEMELKSVQEACYELLGRVLPITFIVVQKRHQTRFKPQNLRDGIGRCGNVPPGTTVDTDVVHPVYFDYFIISHEGIKGTSKPAHYIVLHDDNNFKADELQKFCYELCHVYARCNRSISVPAPAMNAHLAAARAKKYIDWHLSKNKRNSSGHNCSEPSLSPDVIKFVNNISTIKAPMFYV